MRAASAIFLSLLLLWLLLAQINHLLAPAHIYLFAGGLFVTQAALDLRLRPGFAAVLGAGLVCDANAPIPFGTFTLMFAVSYAVLFRLRDRLPHDEPIGRVAIALVANLALYFGLTYFTLRPVPAGAWPRLISDLLISQVFLGLVAPWFFALQQRALELTEEATSPFFRT